MKTPSDRVFEQLVAHARAQESPAAAPELEAVSAPPDPAELDRIIRGALSRVDAGVQASSPGSRTDVARSKALGAEPMRGVRDVAPLAAGIAALALAAGALLMAWPVANDSDVAYGIEVRSQELSQRGAVADGRTPSVQRLSLGSELRVVLRPSARARAASAPQWVRVTARDRHGHMRVFRPQIEPDPSGAILARAIIGEEAPLSPGRWRLRFSVWLEDERWSHPDPELELWVVAP